jgi:hypothetical protein
MSHTFVLSWDCTGLEACINVSDIDKERMWDALKSADDNPNKGRPHTVGSLVNMLMLRARFNTQRHYEIYAIDTDDSITACDLRELFEQDPQAGAELIRDRGRKLYSDRIDFGRVAIR